MLFVRNLANTVTEEILEKAFSQFGKLERVKKLKDYAFIHFDEEEEIQYIKYFKSKFTRIIIIVLNLYRHRFVLLSIRKQ